jgi:2-dehydropantoate 2-reductase
VIGARLFTAGFDTALIARGAHLEAIRAKGLRVVTSDGAATLPIPAAGHPRELQFGDGDVVFLTMKTQDTEAALVDLLDACPAQELPVVCAQNGVENERLALRRFSRVYGMLVILPATHMEPGVVEATSSGVPGVLDAGCYPAGCDDLIMKVCADLEKAGFRARPDERIMRLKYAKLLGNLNNTLQAALGNVRAGDISRMLADEAVACYQAAGIEWAPDDEMASLRRGMVGGGGRQGSSTWQSLARGAGSIETDYLNGEIALLGRLHGVPTPANAALQRIGRRLLAEGRPPGSMKPEDVMSEIASATAIQ